MVNAGEGTDLVMTDDAAAGNGASQEERIAQGTAVHEQIARGASLRRQNRQAAPEGGRIGTPEQARVGTPGRRAEAPGEGRVPGWLQTGASVLLGLLFLDAHATGRCFRGRHAFEHHRQREEMPQHLAVME